MRFRQLDPRMVDHTGGVVVVTRFTCPHAWMLLWLRWQHRRVRVAVSRRSMGFIGASLSVQRSELTAYSITLWRHPQALYDMGEVPEHIDVVKRAGRLGILTDAAVFPYLDHWSNLLFGARLDLPSPLSVPGSGDGRPEAPRSSTLRGSYERPPAHNDVRRIRPDGKEKV